MSQRSQYPAGVPCWIDIAHGDPEAATAFYGELLGWEFAGPGAMPGDPPGRYYVARVRGMDVAGVSSRPPQAAEDPDWLTYVAVDSADSTAQRAREAGGSVIVEPFDAPPAGRMAVLRDPAGALFAIWEAGHRQGAQLVNEPSAWSMSSLNTSDSEGAEAFYGAVYGWEAEAFGPDISLFRLPGYVGGEPGQPVPRDVVAGMMTGDGEARWSVDVWVADAEMTARKAAGLGGSVAVAPREIAGFRNAVISDPQGGSLSVSQLLVHAGAS